MNDNSRLDSLAKDDYLVALKLIVRDGTKILIMKDAYGNWDIPGGRIRKDQFDVQYEQILREKIDVELGKDFQYELKDIKTLMRVQREESGRGGEMVRIFGVGYEAKYLEGKIKLADYISEFRWIDILTTDLSDYHDKSGWVDKLSDYQDKVRKEVTR